ncbi:MAG: hypothetical protein H3C35_11210 [Bacteroidetes bacterium]|nr:hypothetical protein [Bacteroidota bacterium]
MNYRKKFFILCVSALLLFGCKKNEDNKIVSPDTTTPNPLPSNLFPLTAGHSFQFAGYLTENSTENKITGTENSFSASWTVAGTVSLNSILPSGTVQHLKRTHSNLIYDSVSVTGVLPAPKVTPVFVYKDSLSGDYYYLTNFGYVFRKYLILDSAAQKVRGDSLQFIKLASPKAGLQNSFECFTAIYQASGIVPSSVISLTLHITAEFEKKESLQIHLNGKDTTLQAYYLVVKNTPTIGTITDVSSVTAKFWLVEGIGPVQMFLAGDDEAPGSFRKLTAKNF